MKRVLIFAAALAVFWAANVTLAVIVIRGPIVAAGTPFSPGDLPNLTVWLEADGDVWTTGTTQAAAGDPSETWVNQSSAGNAATTGGQRPTFRFPGGGFPYLEFDGADDNLEIADGAGVELDGDFTLIVAGRVQYGGGINQPIISKDSAANSAGAALVFLDDSSNKLEFDRPWVEAGAQSTNTYADNTWFVLAVKLSGTSLSYYKNGAANGTDTIAAGTATSQPLRIGKYIDGGGSWLGDIDLFAVIICTSALSSGDLDAAEDYLGAKVGVTITH